eukprot:NODE_52_length_1973_cov_217.807692_g51_i0.p1 GENE.NODE_52_length_1973_cov_217.807692_g51_i0~~NODE_52_length_1973_cov_217.807692_g51_i0.p1  ORF type:complete len:396 (+),score=140.93 NODE_52_length_1973_cov_217.807692_g51_i0:238-1425(+)
MQQDAYGSPRRNPDTTKDPVWKKTQGLALNNASPVRVRVHKPPHTTVVQLDDSIDPESETALLVKKGLVSTEGVVQEEEEELPAERQVYRRKVKRIVEVPCPRKVKVPVMSKKIINTTEKQRVKSTELQVVEEWKEVPETYTEIEEVECIRMKEVWVKKIVPQKYTKKVEVEKSKMVKVPVQTTQEVEVWKEVDVPIQKEIDVPGYRIDEVVDTKIVEVDGWQEIELLPHLKDLGTLKVEAAREISGPTGKHSKRKTGQIYSVEDERLDQVDTDSDTDDEKNHTLSYEGNVIIDGTESRVKHPDKIPTSARLRQQQQQQQQPTSPTAITAGPGQMVPQAPPGGSMAQPQIPGVGQIPPGYTAVPVHGQQAGTLVPTPGGTIQQVHHTPQPPPPRQ